MTSKLLYDTNVYIRCLRSVEYQRARDEQFVRHQPRTFFCSVVAQELLAGCRDDLSTRRVHDLYRPYVRVRRTVTPRFSDWEDAGEILANILRDRAGRASKLASLCNDVLIALCARRLGAAVVSANEGDFSLIREYRTFELRIL